MLWFQLSYIAPNANSSQFSSMALGSIITFVSSSLSREITYLTFQRDNLPFIVISSNLSFAELLSPDFPCTIFCVLVWSYY